LTKRIWPEMGLHALGGHSSGRKRARVQNHGHGRRLRDCNHIGTPADWGPSACSSGGLGSVLRVCAPLGLDSASGHAARQADEYKRARLVTARSCRGFAKAPILGQFAWAPYRPFVSHLASALEPPLDRWEATHAWVRPGLAPSLRPQLRAGRRQQRSASSQKQRQQQPAADEQQPARGQALYVPPVLCVKWCPWGT